MEFFDTTKHCFSSGNDLVAMALMACFEGVDKEKADKLTNDFAKNKIIEIDLKFNGIPVNFTEIVKAMLASYDQDVENKAKEIVDTKMQPTIDFLVDLEYNVKELVRVSLAKAIKQGK